MKKIIVLLFLVLPAIGHSESILIPGPLVSPEQLQQQIRKSPNQISIQDFWIKKELTSNLALDKLVNDFELALQDKLSWDELQKRLITAKKVAFGNEHRKLLLDYLDKKSSSEKKSNINTYLCLEKKIESLSDIMPCSEDETSMKNIIPNEVEFPIVIVDGYEMSTQKLKLLNLPQIEIRLVFISSNWLPVEFIGKPSELAQKSAPQNALLKNENGQNQLNIKNSFLEKNSTILNADGSLNFLSTVPVAESPSWWQRNKSWALPSLIAFSGFAIYQMRNESVTVEIP